MCPIYENILECREKALRLPYEELSNHLMLQDLTEFCF